MPGRPAMTIDNTVAQLQKENAELRGRLELSEEPVRALRAGEVDAITLETPEGMRIFALKGAEQPYRVMVESMSEGAVTVGSDGMILYGNRRFAEMAGTDLSKLIGSKLQTYFARQDGARLGTALLDFGISRFQAQMLDTQSGTVSVSVSSQRLSGDRNENIVCVVVSDLTDFEAARTADTDAHLALQQRLAELQKSEHRYHSLLDTMSEGLIEIDESPSLTYVNPRFTEMLGYPVEDLVDQPVIRFLANEPEARLHERVAARKKGHSETYELTWRHRDGH
jgi:PAS domain S-box-containing protein